MHDVFRGWRRKVGCVMLVVASAFMAGWIRSRSVQDRLFVREHDAHCYLLTSSPDGIAWIRVVDVMGFGLRTMPFYQAKAAKEPTDTAHFRHQHGEYRWEWAGFRFCKGWQILYPIEFWCVPYWAVTMPLTLLSAWLMLGKPRKRESGPTDCEGSL